MLTEVSVGIGLGRVPSVAVKTHFHSRTRAFGFMMRIMVRIMVWIMVFTCGYVEFILYYKFIFLYAGLFDAIVVQISIEYEILFID